MSDIKPKLILRPGVSISEKSPSPSTKLMLNHGKPNFTIDRSKPKSNVSSPQTPTTPEASQVILKSTTFNGVITPSSLKITQKNKVNSSNSSDNEVDRVVLRRTKLPDVNDRAVVQDDEPEFIKAQRKIAERLAKEGNLDFENRKSGYFTHVMMSPTSPTKNVEMPLIESAKIQHATVIEAVDEPRERPPEKVEQVKENGQEAAPVVETTENGVDKPEVPEPVAVEAFEDKQTEVVAAAKALVEEVVQKAPELVPEAQSNENGLQNGHENGEVKEEQNGEHTTEQSVGQNTPSNAEQNKNQNDSQKECQTASHNGDVNFEPKTVVSFSKELSNEPNKYPDTVKVTSEVAATGKDAELLQEMSKLKFDINTDSEDITVTPVLHAAPTAAE